VPDVSVADSEARLPATAGQGEVSVAGAPPSRFEQKDLTGDYGAAGNGANRYILPENIDLVRYAENYERVFAPGLITRTK
jgi:hypothetical protein